MKELLSKLIDYAFFEKFKDHPIKSFFLSVLFNWGVSAIASIVPIGILVLITGGNFIKYVLYFCLLFAGGPLVYPFVAALMRGHEEAYGYSYGFYYGALGLTVLFHNMKFINGTDMEILVATVISALVCVIVYYKRKN